MDEITPLEEKVRVYESGLIREALEASGNKLEGAAELLGLTRQGLAYIIETRHPELTTVRSKVIRRPRRGEQQADQL